MPSFLYRQRKYVLVQNRQPLQKEYGRPLPFKFSNLLCKKTLSHLKIVHEQVFGLVNNLDCLALQRPQSKSFASLWRIRRHLRPYLPEHYLTYYAESKGDAMAGAIFVAKNRMEGCNI